MVPMSVLAPAFGEVAAAAVDVGAADGPADLVFLIAAPEGAGADHMALLSSLARALVRPDFVASLRAAQSPADIVALVDGVVRPAAKAPKSIVAITACPMGVLE